MSTTNSPIQQALAALARRESLSEQLATEVFGALMQGEVTPAQAGALLLGLRVKGETADEVAGAARALRSVMLAIQVSPDHLVDTCGTGGGRVTTFNISTAAAFVAAGAGATVAKHGNRSFTSKCGSADVLEAMGVSITLGPDDAARALREAHMAFLFAPTYHPAMKHVGPVRRELGVPSIMNLLGPLVNPAGVRRQIVGVADPHRGPVMADALMRLGADHVWVVHGKIGMDEISPTGLTDVWEVRDGHVTTWELDPAPHGLAVSDPALLRGGDPGENAIRVTRLLEANGRAAADADGMAAVLLNAGAAIYLAGLAESYEAAIELGRAALRSGAAREALERLRRVTSTS
jgi:anthranilate phosphoribosyltransferase